MNLNSILVGCLFSAFVADFPSTSKTFGQETPESAPKVEDPIGRALDSARKSYRADMLVLREACFAKLEPELAAYNRKGDVTNIKRILDSKQPFLDGKIDADKLPHLGKDVQAKFNRDVLVLRDRYSLSLDTAKKAYLATKNLKAAEAIEAEEYALFGWLPIQDGMKSGLSTIHKPAVWSIRIKKGQRLSIQAKAPLERIIHLHVLNHRLEIVSAMINERGGEAVKEKMRFLSETAKEETIFHVMPHGKTGWDPALPWIALPEIVIENGANESTKVTWRFSGQKDNAVNAIIQVK